MTEEDADERLVAVLGATGPVLFDFDGPITYLLPPPANAELAEAARRPLRRAGIDIPSELASSSDHLAVLRFAATQGPKLTSRVDTVCTTGEIEGARRSAPTDGAHNAIRALRRVRRPVVIVSNNATEAVETYLHRHGLDSLVSGVVGRRGDQPELMKPDTDPIERALRIVDADPADCVLIGDSVTDIEVSHRGGLRSVGYAKTPIRGEDLAAAGADTVVDSMTTVAAVLTHQP